MNRAVDRPQQEVPPSEDAYVPPTKHDFESDRFNLTQISALAKDIAQLSATLQANTQTLSELRADAKQNSADVTQLGKDLSSHISFAKGAAAVLVVVCTGLGFAWSSIIKPGLAHAIVEQVKPEISKQVTDTVKAQQPAPATKGK
ncbi:hypothetical protein [Comamonas aquatica]|uniref:hypothetical protein n=1 Tax=Comamonas aquatica TaxID=225991 RepID=UPI0012DF9047|nr:hypothetical protein [Comamonas aquatica]